VKNRLVCSLTLSEERWLGVGSVALWSGLLGGRRFGGEVRDPAQPRLSPQKGSRAVWPRRRATIDGDYIEQRTPLLCLLKCLQAGLLARPSFFVRLQLAPDIRRRLAAY
jgi:hypothetical protein